MPIYDKFKISFMISFANVRYKTRQKLYEKCMAFSIAQSYRLFYNLLLIPNKDFEINFRNCADIATNPYEIFVNLFFFTFDKNCYS